MTSFDAWAHLDELHRSVCSALSIAGVEFLAIADRTLPHPLVAIRATDVRAALTALAESEGTGRCKVAPMFRRAPGVRVPAARRPPQLPGVTGWLVTKDLFSPSRQPLLHSEFGVLLDLWKDAEVAAPLPGGHPPQDALVTSTPNGVLNYLGSDVWGEAQIHGHRLPSQWPNPMIVNEPVDLVYTWVDGDDPAWLTRKQRFLGAGLNELQHSTDAAIHARFRDRDELRYSLRSVQAYANWVRHIWIVTDRQIPSWLRTDHPRLTVVDHRDVFADPEALPSFNSHAIESQLHHIRGLANLYIYLNDDVLFGRPVAPEQFFHGNGLVKFYPSPALIDPYERVRSDPAVTAAAKNNRAFIAQTFERTISNKLRHAPHPQSREVMEQFEAEHPEVFDTVMRSRFRHRDDVALASSLGQYYAFAKGRAVSGRIANGYVDLAGATAVHTMEAWLRRRDRDSLCINDSGSDNPELQRSLGQFLQEYFPLPSEWERG